MALTFDILKASCAHLVERIYQLEITDYNSFLKIYRFTFFPQTKGKRDQTDIAVK